ncbi:hypothetical protein LTR15_011715 [Elasticomyces elasticus]|nr:hypothetical protein LTR15_011715 [Elasticomyces elasticus]
MRPLARQSIRLARTSSRNRTPYTRPFTSTARQSTDVRPPNGDTPEHIPEQQRRATENGVPKPAEAERETETKTTTEVRKPMRKTLRQSSSFARRPTEVPKPPPVPEWFLEHNVYLAVATDEAEAGTKEVLRCVDAETGHTLFTLPYYEAPPTLLIRGKEVDVSLLDPDVAALSKLPDHLREEMFIHGLQTQRARKVEEFDQQSMAGLAELLVTLPRDLQKEILRRESVEKKKEKKEEKKEMSSGDSNIEKLKAELSARRNTLGRDFFAQKAPTARSAQPAASLPTKRIDNASYAPLDWVTLEAELAISAALALPTNPTPASRFSSSRVDLSLTCPDPESGPNMDDLVLRLASSTNADYIRITANDLAELCSDYVDGGSDTPGSFSNLAYDVFENLHAQGLSRPGKITAMFGRPSEEEMDEDDMDEDDEEDEDDDDEHEGGRGQGGVEFGTMDDLRKALQDKRGSIGKALSGMGIAGIQIGVPKGFPFRSSAEIQSRMERSGGSDYSAESNWDGSRLTALLDGVIEAAKLKRTEAGVQRGVQAGGEAASRRLSTARMLASCVAPTDSSGNGTKLEPVQHTSSNTIQPLQRTIIHLRDLQALNRTELGSKIVASLVKVVQKRRRAGESVMIVGTTSASQDPMSLFMASRQDKDTSFRSMTIPPTFKSSPDEAVKLEASIMGGKNAEVVGVGGDDRILAINMRHVRSMLSRLKPGQVPDLRAKSTLEQMKIKGTAALGERVMSLDQVQRLVLTAIGLAETHAKSDVVQPVHIALATALTTHVDAVVQTWNSNDRISKFSSHFRKGSGEGGKDAPEDAVPSKVEEIRSGCNSHETKLLTGVVDAKNIKTGFADVHAPASTIEALKTLTSLSLLRPEAFTYGILANDRLPGLLLYGPPGTGKTLLAKAVAKESKATVLEVTGAQIYEKYVGEGEKMVRAVFSLAKKLSPCVVFIDEADAIFGSRSGGGGGNRNTHREIINQFLREWDGMDDRGVFVMVASNRPFDLDDAVLRRLPRRVLVDLPAAKDRESILGIHLKNELLDPKVELGKLAEQTPLYSGSDLKNLCVAAALAAVREENELAVSKAEDKDFKLPEKRILMSSHFETAVKEISASISEDMSSLGAIRKFDEQFGDRKGRKKKAAYGFGAGIGEEAVDERSVMVRQPEVGASAPP